MNSLHAFLSNAILALSVSTILLTLLSYLVFKIRQLPKTFSGPAAKPTRGTFFNRYDPFPKPVQVSTVKAVPLKNYRPLWTKSPAVFFGVVTAVIFVTLASEQLLENHSIRKERRGRAETFQKLKQDGLLKSYAYDANLKNPSISEWISEERKNHLKSLIASFQSKKIGAIGTLWAPYLKHHGIRTITTRWALMSNYDAVFISYRGKLDKEQKNAIDQALNRGTLIFASGDFGEAKDKWLSDTFGIGWTEANESIKLPTLIKGDGAPGWDLSAGTLIEWFPGNSHKVALATGSAEAVLFQSNFEGRFVEVDHKRVVRETLSSQKKGRAIWFGLEPAELLESDSFYGDTMVFESLSWGLRRVTPKVEQWKNAAQGAIAFSVDSEDLFEGASRLRKLFDKESVPATFFIVSDLLEKSPGLVKTKNPIFDFASHTANHGILDGLPLYDQFRELERSRLTIEELSGKKVRGFRPPEERYDATTLNAALQSHYEFFFGDQRLHRFAPVSIAQGKLIYYPRSNLDDIILMGDHSISDEVEMAKALENEMNRILSVNGAYFLSTHSQYFGQDPFFDSVAAFIASLKKLDVWKTNFAEMTDWARARDLIKVKDLTITNTSQKSIDGLGIWVGVPMKSVTNAKLKVVKTDELGTRLVISHLEANESINLNNPVISNR